MIKKILGLVAAAAAIAAAAVLCVVTLALALYASLAGVIGPAWAYACVAGVALLFVAVALLIAHRVKEKPPQQDTDLVGQLFELARKKPLFAAAAAAAAGAVLLRNPGVMTGLLAAFLAPKPTGRR